MDIFPLTLFCVSGTWSHWGTEDNKSYGCRLGPQLCVLRCVYRFAEMHYSPFKISSYRPHSHLCSFHQWFFLERCKGLLPVSWWVLSSIEFNGIAWKMHVHVFLVYFSTWQQTPPSSPSNINTSQKCIQNSSKTHMKKCKMCPKTDLKKSTTEQNYK